MLNQQRTFLCETSARFARFLMTTQSRQDDPFLSGLIRMVEEEKTIVQRDNQSNFNQQLVGELEKVKKEYQIFFNATHWENDNEALSDLYDLMRSVNEISMIKEQMNAVKEYQQRRLASSEQNFCTTKTSF
jgi:3-dehydroquinate dehydratase